MINLEIPKKFKPLVEPGPPGRDQGFRPISRKYDLAEHAYPKELDMLAALIDGMNDPAPTRAPAPPASRADPRTTTAATATAPTWPRCSASSRCAGATSA